MSHSLSIRREKTNPRLNKSWLWLEQWREDLHQQSDGQNNSLLQNPHVHSCPQLHVDLTVRTNIAGYNIVELRVREREWVCVREIFELELTWLFNCSYHQHQSSIVQVKYWCCSRVFLVKSTLVILQLWKSSWESPVVLQISFDIPLILVRLTE